MVGRCCVEGLLGGSGRVGWSGPSRKLFNSTRRDRFKWLVESLQDRLDFFTLHTFLPTLATTTAAAAADGYDATAAFLANIRRVGGNVSRRRRRWSQRSLVCESNIVLTTFSLVDKQIVTHFFLFYSRTCVLSDARVCVSVWVFVWVMWVGVCACICFVPTGVVFILFLFSHRFITTYRCPGDL